MITHYGDEGLKSHPRQLITAPSQALHLGSPRSRTTDAAHTATHAQEPADVGHGQAERSALGGIDGELANELALMSKLDQLAGLIRVATIPLCRPYALKLPIQAKKEFSISDAQPPEREGSGPRKARFVTPCTCWTSDRCLPPVIAIGIVNGIRLLDVVAAQPSGICGRRIPQQA